MLILSVTLNSLAFARMPPAEARGGMVRGDLGEARRAKSDGFGAAPLGFATDGPRGSAGSFPFCNPRSEGGGWRRRRIHGSWTIKGLNKKVR